MRQYLLSIYQPDGPPPASVNLDQIGRDLDILNDEMEAAGAWVFADGLFPPSTASVVRLQDGDLLVTDGPYIESQEHLIWRRVCQGARRNSPLTRAIFVGPGSAPGWHIDGRGQTDIRGLVTA